MKLHLKATLQPSNVIPPELEVLNGFNIHDFDSITNDMKSLELSQQLLDEYSITGDLEKIATAIQYAVKNKIVKIVDTKYMPVGGRDVLPSGKKIYPWMIHAQIDHNPYIIYMKFPIKFDTSY